MVKAEVTGRSALDRILASGRLRIAVSFSAPPEEGEPPEFYIDPESGEPSGVVCELGKRMAQDLGVGVEFVDLPWPHHLSGLLEGRVDLLLSYTNTPERALAVEFAGRLLPSRVVVMVRRESAVERWEELDREESNLAVARGSSILAVARRRFPRAEIRELDHPASGLLGGEVDAAVVDAVTRRFLERNPGVRLLRDALGRAVVLAEEWGHPAVRPNDPRFLNWLKNWLLYHQAQGTLAAWCGKYWLSFMAD
jgi:polar amino acid transport system substrate-binding protein